MVAGDRRRLRAPSRTARRRRRRPGSSSPPADGTTGGNMEGKEQRNGIVASAEWATVTTDASNGSVNSAHDSYTGIGGAVPLANMMTGEVIFGGVGSGLYGMLLFVLLTVFIAGPDGRANARVPGQEDRGPRDQARADRASLVMPMVVLGLHGARDRDQVGRPLDLQRQARRGSPRRSTPSSRRPTTTARRSPATPASCSRTRPATSARTGSRSPTSLGGVCDARSGASRSMLAALAIGRLARRQAGLAGRPRHLPHRHADLRRPAARRR